MYSCWFIFGLEKCRIFFASLTKFETCSEPGFLWWDGVDDKGLRLEVLDGGLADGFDVVLGHPGGDLLHQISAFPGGLAGMGVQVHSARDLGQLVGGEQGVKSGPDGDLEGVDQQDLGGVARDTVVPDPDHSEYLNVGAHRLAAQLPEGLGCVLGGLERRSVFQTESARRSKQRHGHQGVHAGWDKGVNYFIGRYSLPLLLWWSGGYGNGGNQHAAHACNACVLGRDGHLRQAGVVVK
ncbi:hypothetical protein OJ252_3001 [Cryptosporidium canis]|uniref:Uncharacterized protein n=1 Tax=Cryptosporidium canis TaxID=195482 RepID=A0ABQ8P3N0_9CRYT|nr:hypothetical protein OJ252_3001 [Cryptosporidium canis]